MVAWLKDYVAERSQVLTANRRLARLLIAEYDLLQQDRGLLDWKTPAIASLRDWLKASLNENDVAGDAPVVISVSQAQILWERCLRREISDPLMNWPALVSAAQDAWQRMADWQVAVEDCARTAMGRDQQIFARAADNYRSILDANGWIDDALLLASVVQRLSGGELFAPREMLLCGFDRLTPADKQLLAALENAGSQLNYAPAATHSCAPAVHAYDNADAELRAAGRWARSQLESDEVQSIAIVVSGLEQQSLRKTRLVREGFAPGWQFQQDEGARTVNVSYGQRLSDYPACAVALTLLRWLRSGLSSADVSILLRSPLLGIVDEGQRSRMELLLRDTPDRDWTPELCSGYLRSRLGDKPLGDWVTRLDHLAAAKKGLPLRASPTDWVELIDELLRAVGWPGETTLRSDDFQLINRWRDLLNEFARLDVVLPELEFSEVLRRLTSLATSAVFQPEQTRQSVTLIGALEAAGLEFDALWIAGLTASNWPPPGRPSPLISRQLQRDLGMPDAEPQDSNNFAQRVLQRLQASAPVVVCSYALTDGDAEQAPSGLLPAGADSQVKTVPDPGYFATTLAGSVSEVVLEEHVPAVTVGETLHGGAGTLQQQLSEPFAAFCFGRLGVRPLQRFSRGLTPGLRGNIIHAAAQCLYQQLPDQASIAHWNEQVRAERSNQAAATAVGRFASYTDALLDELLAREQRRVTLLLQRLIELDCQREPFRIVALEESQQTTISGVDLRLRLDRLDELADGSKFVIDYKTGAQKQFSGRDGEPRDFQLVVYAMAIGGDIADLALFNVDSRDVGIAGAGRNLTPTIDWPESLAAWKQTVAGAAAQIQAGDARINCAQSLQSARPLALLSRIAELTRG